MTVIVDNFRVPKRIGRISGRWSHLTADTADELHAFAGKLGLRRSWFQDKGDGRWHYDVVDSKRDEAIRLGAKAVNFRELGDFVRRRRLAAASIPDLPGFAEFYGVKVSSAGEDGDLVALGHHDKRTALAVFNAYVRHTGHDDLHDYTNHHIDDPYSRISQSWAVVVTQCGQPDCEGAECGECAEIKQGRWYLRWGKGSDTPGAFPVTDWA